MFSAGQAGSRPAGRAASRPARRQPRPDAAAPRRGARPVRLGRPGRRQRGRPAAARARPARLGQHGSATRHCHTAGARKDRRPATGQVLVAPAVRGCVAAPAALALIPASCQCATACGGWSVRRPRAHHALLRRTGRAPPAQQQAPQAGQRPARWRSTSTMCWAHLQARRPDRAPRPLGRHGNPGRIGPPTGLALKPDRAAAGQPSGQLVASRNLAGWRRPITAATLCGVPSAVT